MSTPLIVLTICCIGALSCTVLAIFVKPLNLGLIGNLVTGAVSSFVSVFFVGRYISLQLVFPTAILVPMLAMTLIGLYLNRRAR